ncbi:hypothetical protein MGL_3011 [Malassezia globosa CBS 7966]|uniref:Rab-GAP TBC domain-containing protein n=1 Tax=Malassezia globosa (strain ATCC MYA-4612 / CBS 7966) TaxID=425265 RepID=A8Q6M7_MALGO|nr:uncharacterized protein MGL_3011 [Malassezia globosa CBS 7966]EDP42811.1 hypothetical protein MGL_3011 [Malassezia globosa CBS 7966]
MYKYDNRQEVWLYLLGVLSADKSQEMTAVRNKFLEYEGVSKRIPAVEKEVRTEVLRYFRRQLDPNQRRSRPDTNASTCCNYNYLLADIRALVIRQTRLSQSDEHSELGNTSEDELFERPSIPRILPSTQYGLATMRECPNVDDSVLIHEQRRLSQSVENVLCAYLNRHLLAAAEEKPDQQLGEARACAVKSMSTQTQKEFDWPINLVSLPGNRLNEFHPSMVYLCAPFAQCVRAEAGMYFAFERLMSMIAQYNEVHPVPQRVATFLTLFRTTLPELYAYFEAEEVDILAVATSWLQHLLAREMQTHDLMRLWDTYFAVPDLLDLHLYVCLAILTNCRDALEDLDRSETMSMLFSLPPMDVDRIISDAVNIRLSLEHDEMYE